MMNKNEAVQKLSAVGHISRAYAEDLYDSIIPKPIVPQYVADWYEEIKDSFNYDLIETITTIPYGSDEEDFSDFEKWLDDEKESLTILINMHQFGYEVEKEKRYTVKLKNKVGNEDYLVNTETNGFRFYNGIYMNHRFHTRKELEEADFGWVFDCPGVEVKEVDDGND
nr:MAG TPA: Protein of unknown function (DUF1642) [Caudoviricetes sp.]